MGLTVCEDAVKFGDGPGLNEKLGRTTDPQMRMRGKRFVQPGDGGESIGQAHAESLQVDSEYPTARSGADPNPLSHQYFKTFLTFDLTSSSALVN